MLRSFMRPSLEKHDGRVNWSTIRWYSDLKSLPDICKATGDKRTCMANLLGVCEMGDRCENASSHAVRLSDQQAQQLKAAIASRVKALMEQGPRKKYKRKRPRED